MKGSVPLPERISGLRRTVTSSAPQGWESSTSIVARDMLFVEEVMTPLTGSRTTEMDGGGGSITVRARTVKFVTSVPARL